MELRGSAAFQRIPCHPAEVRARRPPGELALDGRPGHTGRVRNKATTRRRLSEAALALFATQGYDETTTRQIAAAAHVTERSFFKHFSVKADAIVDLPPEDLEMLEAMILEERSDLSDALLLEQAVTRWYLRFGDMERKRGTQRLLVQASSTSVVIRGRLGDYLDLCVTTAARALAGRRGDSEPTPSDLLLASVVLRAHSFIIREWIRSDTSHFADVAAEHYRELNQQFAGADLSGLARPRNLRAVAGDSTSGHRA
jgi:AcrR family transcriptional regulator